MSDKAKLKEYLESAFERTPTSIDGGFKLHIDWLGKHHVVDLADLVIKKRYGVSNIELKRSGTGITILVVQ